MAHRTLEAVFRVGKSTPRTAEWREGGGRKRLFGWWKEKRKALFGFVEGKNLISPMVSRLSKEGRNRREKEWKRR